MKFDKVTPKQKWPIQKVYQRISMVEKDIADLNRTMNRVDGEQNRLFHVKESIRSKVKNKWKYLKQLKEQLKECKSISVQTGT